MEMGNMDNVKEFIVRSGFEFDLTQNIYKKDKISIIFADNQIEIWLEHNAWFIYREVENLDKLIKIIKFLESL